MTAPGCGNRANCPVPAPTDTEVGALTTVVIAAGVDHSTVFRHPPGGGFNATGLGDTRFAPLFDGSGAPLPSRYSAASKTAALLETVFHDVHPLSGADRIVPRSTVARYGFAVISFPAGVTVVDLRDDALAAAGLSRAGLVTTTAAHYACTRAWAEAIRAAHPHAAGLMWNSRVAELARADSFLLDDLLVHGNAEVVVLYGDRISVEPADWWATISHPTLAAGEGSILIDEIAHLLDTTIVDT